MSFFINEDIELLRLMGLDSATADEMRAVLTPEIFAYYQSTLKNGLHLPSTSILSDASFRATSVAPQPAPSIRRNSISMTGPAARSRKPTTAQNAGSLLKNQINAGSLASSSQKPSRPPLSPQPIGHTGIFRKSSGASNRPTQPATPKPVQKSGLVKASPMFALKDYGISFSDNFDHDQPRLL